MVSRNLRKADIFLDSAPSSVQVALRVAWSSQWSTATLPYSPLSPSLTIAPGGVGYSTLTVDTSAATTFGSYSIIASAAKAGNPAHTDSATAGLALLESCYTVSLNVSGNGTITVQETGATCAGSCQITIPQTAWSGLNLEASPNNRKHQLCSWTDACSSATGSTCSLSSPGD